MKKVLLITVISIIGFTNAQAQDVEFGAKLAINYANLYGDYDGDDSGVTSLINFGVMSEIHINEKFSFQPEIMYSMQGFSTGNGDDDLVNLNYLNVPLMGKYYITKGFSVEAGPQIGFLLSAKNDGDDVKSSFKGLDLGVNFGLGYKLENGLNFGARYNLGVSNINDVDGSSSKFRNGVAQVSVGYFFL
jgi:opacity protein-like surface antigen